MVQLFMESQELGSPKRMEFAIAMTLLTKWKDCFVERQVLFIFQKRTLNFYVRYERMAHVVCQRRCYSIHCD
jgi:hypothetical protein